MFHAPVSPKADTDLFSRLRVGSSCLCTQSQPVLDANIPFNCHESLSGAWKKKWEHSVLRFHK